MKVTLDREGKNIVKLGLEVESDRAMRAYEQACRQLSHKVNIPGFRRGKAPRHVLEKTVGVEYIKQETLERLLPEMLGEAIANESLDVITQPEVDSYQFDLGQPLKLQDQFEVRPQVTLGKYKDIVVEVPQSEFKESAVDDALTRVAASRSELTVIDPRPIKMDDTVLLDFECFVDNKLVDGGKAEGLVLEIKADSFLPGFCEQLVGKEPGKELEIKTSFPSDYRNQQLAGKDAVFKTKIRELKQKTIPAIDDALAQKLGQESLDKLKTTLKERLKEEFDLAHETNKQKLVIEAIVKNASVDLPETMVEREQKLLLEQMKHYLQSNGQSFDDFEKSPEFEAIKTAKYNEAKQRVLTSLVLGEIIKEEKVSVTEEELGTHLQEFIYRHGLPEDKAYSNENIRRQAQEELLTAKVLEVLLQNVQISYITEPVPDSQPDQTALDEKKEV